MQTERVTFLTSRDHKAALDAFANANGISVGHLVREATSSFISRDRAPDDREFSMLLDELEAAVPRWNTQFDAMEAALDGAHRVVADALASCRPAVKQAA